MKVLKNNDVQINVRMPVVVFKLKMGDYRRTFVSMSREIREVLPESRALIGSSEPLETPRCPNGESMHGIPCGSGWSA